LVVLSVALVVLLCDQIASGFCKPFFHRFRPTHHPDFQEQVKTVFGYRGGKYGFISGHAANSFGFAVFTACLFRNKLFTGTILLFAAINAYSRIYLGVHFLSDIVVGGIVGAVIGFSVYRLSVWSKRKFFKISTSNFKEASYPIESVYFLCIVYLIVVTTFLLCSYRFSP
jgi:undecaprenyl-diphosphatase